MAKPVVDRLEGDLAGRAEVIRINVVSSLGRGLIGRYGVRAVPTLVVLDGAGQATYQATGIPDREAVAAAVDALIDR